MEELPGLYFMRARYYSAESGVFLSTDPMKKIEPGWKPTAYLYANENPLRFVDPDGNIFVRTIFDSAVTYSAGYSLGKGKQVSGSIGREGIEPFTTQDTYGLSIGASESVEFLSIQGGEQTDWDNYDEVNVGVKLVIGDVDLALKWSFSGKWGFTVSAGVGPGIGVDVNVIKGEKTPLNSSRSSGAGNYAQMANQKTETLPHTSQAYQLNTSNGAAGSSGNGSSSNNGGGSGDSGGNKSPSGGSGSSGLFSTYTVKAGDTLGNIGYKYGSSAGELGRINAIKNVNLIRPGQKLKIPRR